MTRAYQRHTYNRWLIVCVLAVSTALNYLDRQTLSILIVTIQREIHLTDRHYSLMTTGFVASYTLMTAVAGVALDRFGVRRGLSWAVALWSAACALHALCRSAVQMAAARLLLGVGESANFPAGVKGIAEIFPVEERALAVAIFNSGSSFGAALGVPLIAWLGVVYGWRMCFLTTGLLGFLWLAAFLLVYPKMNRAAAAAEPNPALALDLPAGGSQAQRPGFVSLLVQRRSWGCFAARIFIDPVTYFLIFWVPKFLQDQHGFTLQQLGRLLWAPYLLMAIGTLVGGWLPELMVHRGKTINYSRKLIMGICSVIILASSFVIASQSSKLIILVALGTLMFCHGSWGNITLPAESFRGQIIGTVAGMGGLLGGIAGIAGQYMLGDIIPRYGYRQIFVVAGCMYGVAFLIVCLCIPRLGEMNNE